jgi:hypothetical protein
VSGPTVYAYVGGNPVSDIDPLGLQAGWANTFAQTFNFSSYQAMQLAATAYSAYTQNPAWQEEGPNPITGCFDIGCINANNYLLGWLESGLSTLGGEGAPAAAGLVCRVATPNNVRGLLTALRLFDMHGAQNVIDQLAPQNESVAIQYVLPGGRLNPVVHRRQRRP